jgi:hypothetical protein
MKVIPTSTFLLRVKDGSRVIAKRGVKIEVTEDEYKKLKHKFITP